MFDKRSWLPVRRTLALQSQYPNEFKVYCYLSIYKGKNFTYKETHTGGALPEIVFNYFRFILMTSYSEKRELYNQRRSPSRLQLFQFTCICR